MKLAKDEEFLLDRLQHVIDIHIAQNVVSGIESLWQFGYVEPSDPTDPNARLRHTPAGAVRYQELLVKQEARPPAPATTPSWM